MTVEQAKQEYEDALQKARDARQRATYAQMEAIRLEFDAQVKRTAYIEAKYRSENETNR